MKEKEAVLLDYIGINNEFIASAAFELEDPVFKNISTISIYSEVKGKADLLIIVNKNFKMSELKLIKKEIDRQLKGLLI